MFEKLFLQAKDLLFCILNWDYCGRKAFFLHSMHLMDIHCTTFCCFLAFCA